MHSLLNSIAFISPWCFSPAALSALLKIFVLGIKKCTSQTSIFLIPLPFHTTFHFRGRLPGVFLSARKNTKNRWFLAKSAVKHGCGDRTWTCDLRVMSPTSYQLLHPAINGGGRRIRTFEVEDGRFTVCSLWPLGNPSINKMELAIGIEPTTCWLQVSCSTYWATPASLRQDVFYHPPH